MSSSSFKQSPKSSNGGGNSKRRSISEIIESLHNSFVEADFKAAAKELRAREEGLKAEKEEVVSILRARNDVLEAEVGELKIQKSFWEEERRRMRRDFDVNEDNVKDLTRELSLFKERVEKAGERYSLLVDDIQNLEKEKDGVIGNLEKEKNDLIRNLAYLTDMEQVTKRKLKEKDDQCNVYLEKIEEVQRKNACLEEEKLKFGERFEAHKIKIEQIIKDLMKKHVDERKKFEGQIKAQFEELEDLKRKKEDLEKKDEIVKAKNGKILELEKEKRDLTTKLGEVEERFLKLEGDAISCLCFDLERDKRLESSQIGKILSGIMKVLESEEMGLKCNVGVEKDGIIQEKDSAVVSHIKEANNCPKSDKKPVEDVRRALDFLCGDASGIKRTSCADPIIIDSDDDDENPHHVNGVQNKRQCVRSSREQHNDDGSSDDSLNSKLKTERLEPVLCEKAKKEPSFDHKYNTQTQSLAIVNKSHEKLRREVIAPRSCSFSKDNAEIDDDSKSKYGTPKADKFLSPQLEESKSTLQRKMQLEEYKSTLRQKMVYKTLESAVDMASAFEKDYDFCAKAVCALFRQQKSQFCGKSGAAGLGSKGFQECDSERGTALAKFLIDGDPSGKMKKSVDELCKHDQNGLLDCRRLARRYVKQLFDMYKSSVDPLFSPSSTDLYK